MSPPSIVLGSTSRYRAELLRRLCSVFDQQAPGTDETALDHEAAAARARRLALTKASAVAAGRKNAIVIGSDQVAEVDGTVLDKPGTVERAAMQLTACSGRQVKFHTALCVIDTRNDRRYVHTDLTIVHFRVLTEGEIARYVEREQPLDCAGSFKCEGLGISLFASVDTHDPSAIIGLPLITLAQHLRTCGVALP